MNFVLHNCRIVNEGEVREGDLRVRSGRIDKIDGSLSAFAGETDIDAGEIDSIGSQRRVDF